MNSILKIYTDGACRGNPGVGGWGAILKYENQIKEIKGFSKETTNNIMELTAVIESLKQLNRPCDIIITTDSNYVKNGITEWIHNWKKNGWKTANRQQVKNKELWTELDLLSNEFEIKWSWVKGHSTDKLNNEVDLIARDAANS
mgnify:CR=1 FL=1